MPNTEDAKKKQRQKKLVNDIWIAFSRAHPELSTVFGDQMAQLMNSQSKNYAGNAISFAVDFIFEEIERKGIESFVQQ